MKKPHTCSVLVNVGEKATFDVTYQPKEAARTQATVQLSVEDNQYEDSVIQVTFNLHSISLKSHFRFSKISMKPERKNLFYGEEALKCVSCCVDCCNVKLYMLE